MNSNNSTPPNAIDLALDALREYEQQDETARNSDHEYRREIAGHQAELQRNRATILAQVAIAQAIVALTHTLADGLLSQLVQADADNAALIERLHSYEPIEVPE